MNQSVGKHAVKEFFTESEWKLIYDLVCSNSEWKEDVDCKNHDSIIDKIHSLHKNTTF